MPKISDESLKQNEAALSAEIRRLLPDFVESCLNSEDVVITHQDSFAADYNKTSMHFSAWQSSSQGSTGRKFAPSVQQGNAQRICET
jgi:hypothetical protein